MNRIRAVMMAAALLPLVGCAAQAVEQTTASTPTAVPETATPEPSTTLEPALATATALCGGEPESLFQDWHEWARVNEQPIEGHEQWVTVYVDDLAETPYLTASPPYPVCAVIVKVNHASATDPDITQMTVMVKMPPGYDPENGDWWYGMYDSSGSVAQMSGRVPVCIACHQQAADTDYLFAEQVLEASGR